MGFISPLRLLLVLPLLAVVGFYLIQLIRRRQYAARFTDLSLLASVAPRGPAWWKRHLPAALLLLSLLGMVISLGRPTATQKVPRERATVVMAIDVSNSMAADDVEPRDRLDAIRAATASAGRRTHRGWWAAGGAGLLAASIATAFALTTGGVPQTPDAGPAEQLTTSPTDVVSPIDPDGVRAVYYVGDTPEGPRLYREFLTPDRDDSLAGAVAGTLPWSVFPSGSQVFYFCTDGAQHE